MPGTDDFSDDSSLGTPTRRNDRPDNDFGFAESYESGHRGQEVHTDKPYDEAIEVEASDENVSTPESTPRDAGKSAQKTPLGGTQDTSSAPRFPRAAEPLDG